MYFEGENKEEMGPRRSCAVEFRVRTGEVLRVRTGEVLRVRTGEVLRVRTGEVLRVRTGEALRTAMFFLAVSL